jgi:hypothetical protein
VLPSSDREYWQTVAAIITYQSFISQMRGEAPDPAIVSRRCSGFTVADSRGNLKYWHITEGGIVSGCMVDLGIVNAFEGVTSKDPVIRYQGVPVVARNVRFINCRFVLDFAKYKVPCHLQTDRASDDPSQ